MKWSLIARTIALFAGLGCLFGAGLVLWEFYQNRHASMVDAGEKLQFQTREAAIEFNGELEKYMPAVDLLAQEFDERVIGSQETRAVLERVLEASPGLFGIGVAYCRCAYPDLFAPYLMRRPEGVVYTELQQAYAYDERPPDFWYHRALRLGPNWVNNWGQVTQSWIAVYSVPFRNDQTDCGDDYAGVAFLTYSFDWVEGQLRRLDLGKTGYGFLVSQNGTFMTHPNSDFVHSRKTVYAMAEETGDRSLAFIGDKIKEQRYELSEYLDPISNRDSWLALAPIERTGWVLGVVYLKENAAGDPHLYRKRMILAIALFAAGVYGLGFYSAHECLSRAGAAGLWRCVLAAAMASMLGMSAAWLIVYTQRVDETTVEKAAIIGSSDLASYLDDWQSGEAPPIAVPTGIFVQSLEFESSYNISVVGYIWQRLRGDMPGGFEEGVELPEAVAFSWEEAYRHTDGDETLIGWRFWATLRQQFDYATYPFDFEEIWIRFWPKGFNDRVILTPDFGEYDIINPNACPGVSKEVVLPGWSRVSSFFSYQENEYNASFGFGETARAMPELYFNIAIQRNLTDAVVGHILPLTVAAFMIFAVLMTATRDQEKASMLGFNAFGVVGANSALFFVVLLAHIQLRETIQVQEIIYLEYFYFITYLLILLTSVHALVFLTDSLRSRLLKSGDSLIVKALYWPALLGGLLAVTLARFY